jgi:ribonuclease HI
MKLIIHTDGGARGNPGPAAIGVFIQEDESGSLVTRVAHGERIGETTNNVAEYTAVQRALELVKEKLRRPAGESVTIRFILDSTLVVNQLNGLFKVKEPRLRELLLGVRTREQEVGGHITYEAVRREFNTDADKLVNAALDGMLP